MAATMDDLIATMGRGALVGQEGYDLRALQAHLAQTLYNPQHPSSPKAQQQAFYQPVAGTSALPPAPVSSLNSHFSGSDDECGNAIAGPSGWDTSGAAWQKLETARRPQVTPMPSYYGAAGADVEMDDEDAGGDMDMEEDNQEVEAGDDSDADDGLAFAAPGHGQRDRERALRRQRAAAGTSAQGGGLPSPPVEDGTESESGFSAFESDAFAPLYNGTGRTYGADDDEGARDGGDRTPVPGGGGHGLARTRSAGSGSGWEAFQKRPAGSPKGGWDRYGFNLQPLHQQHSAFGAPQTTSAFGQRPFSPTGSTSSIDQTSQQLYPSFPHASVSPPPIGLPTPPEEKALPRPSSAPNVQLGFGGMTPVTGGNGDESPRRAKRSSGVDDGDRRKWEGRLRSAGQQQQQARNGW